MNAENAAAAAAALSQALQPLAEARKSELAQQQWRQVEDTVDDIEEIDVEGDLVPISSGGARSGPPRANGIGQYVPSNDMNKNFKVVIRVRPPVESELNRGFTNTVRIDGGERSITLSENIEAVVNGEDGGVYSTFTFTFDHVYGESARQSVVYETTARDAVYSTLLGYNATIIAYGQTGTGKTYTMEGERELQEAKGGSNKAILRPAEVEDVQARVRHAKDESLRGIIPRAIEDIFEWIESRANSQQRFLVRASYLQIYNENISDLLKPERTSLVIREDKKRGVYVEGLSEWVVRSPNEVYALMQRGSVVRTTGSTKVHELSSRSHAVFVVIIEQSEPLAQGAANQAGRLPESVKVGKLNLVDLAGSERVRLTGAVGKRLEESKKINQSLSALGNVIAALTDRKGRHHVPYRDSKLTRLLEDSLGGNCRTTMMAMISPSMDAFNETLSTLKFANRAKNIRNEAHINEDLDQKALMRKYEMELKRLRGELEKRSQGLVDKKKLLEVEEEKRQAEADKIAAINALEERSREYIREKQEKRRLEEKITQLEGQLLDGGHKPGTGLEAAALDDESVRSAIEDEHRRIREEYAGKVQELERERQGIEEDKAQVDRYKQLLLKQRDIMIALTARLNERDESIKALQEELDAYDRHQRMMEESLDQKTAALIRLQRKVADGDMKGSDDAATANPTPRSPTPQQRMYAPYSSQVIFGGYGGDDGRLLTAEEKVDELTRLLDLKLHEAEDQAAELEDERAEKVSMEYMMREKMDRLVQSEIERRIEQYRDEVRAAVGPDWKGDIDTVARVLLDMVHANRPTTLAGTDPDGAGAYPSDRSSEVAALQRRLAAAEEESRYAKEKLQRFINKLTSPSGMESLTSVAGSGPSVVGGSPEERQAEIDALKAQYTQFRMDMTQRNDDLTRSVKQKELENIRLKQELERAGFNRPKLNIDEEEVDLIKSSYDVKIHELIRSHRAEDQASKIKIADKEKELSAMQKQVHQHEKEWAAVKTIMEKKVKALVDSISARAREDAAPHNLQRDIASLQKLVNASVAALRSSESGRGQGSSSGGGGGRVDSPRLSRQGNIPSPSPVSVSSPTPDRTQARLSPVGRPASPGGFRLRSSTQQ